jgi:Putative Ig domain
MRHVRISLLVVLLALTGCLDKAKSRQVADASASVTPAANAAPTISGVPATLAQAGSAYSFTPGAADSNGDTLTFQIQNKPQWATFSTANGQLTGTPTANDVGTYANITISVNDGKSSAALSAFTVAVSAPSTLNVAVLLSWVPPTQNTDGTPLTDLAGFNVYYGKSPGDTSRRAQLVGANSLQFWATNLDAGEWFFTVSSYNSAGVESAPSISASTTIG